MATCEYCGTIFSDSRAQCPQCGEPYDPTDGYGGEAGYSASAYGDNYGSSYGRAHDDDRNSPNPAYVYSTPRDRLVLSTGAFLGSLVLMLIPAVGLIIQIVWACGAAKNQNRRNLARAMLVISVIGILLSVVALYFISVFLTPYLDMLPV